MKRAAGIIIKSILGLILVILVLLFTGPLIFKEKIKSSIVNIINESVNARVSFDDYKLGFFRNFPNLTFSLKGVSIEGIDRFENDTLAGFRSLSLVFNLSSLFNSNGYEVKSLVIDNAAVNAIVLEDGSANWDIMKESADTMMQEGTPTEMKILLKKIEILNSSVRYTDLSSNMEALLKNTDFNISGDMTESQTDLQINVKSNELNFRMEGINYLNKAILDARVNVSANLDSMKFNLKDNYLKINDLTLNFAGMVALPGDDYLVDLTFNSGETSFKSLLSMIPSAYMTDFEELTTSGEFDLSGSAKGVYSDTDSTLPDISLKLNVQNGTVRYPSLPEQISNINLRSDIFIDGKNLDGTKLNVDNFHMVLAGNPFDMSFSLKTPVSDPDFSGSVSGKIDLKAFSDAIPMDSLGLSGLINASLSFAGRLSMIENERYDEFKASGNLDLNNLLISLADYPEVSIKNALFSFTPAYAEVENANFIIGKKSDFQINGKLENYIPYILKNEVVKGNLSLKSGLIDLTDIMSSMPVDSTELNDTTSLAVIKVPENIDFDFNASIGQFEYDKIKATDLKGHVIVKDGIVTMKETGMNILGGMVTMTADYDTRDTLKPTVKADLELKNMGIKDAFNTFNTVQKLAPTAKGINGKINAKLSYSSLIGPDFMPVIQTINGSGKLQSEEVTLIESSVFNKMKETLKLGDSFTNTFKDINVSFRINNGRINVSPFDVKAGNIKMNIGGEQGIDQTINYIVKTQIPRSDLGSSVNSLINNLSASASLLGIAYKPADILKVNVSITGTFFKPVIAPFFGENPGQSTSGIKETAGEAVRAAVDNSVDQVKAKARIEAEEQADKLMNEAEEKARLLRDEAAKAAAKIRQEADQQAQRVIKEAEPKGTIAKLAAQKGAESLKKEADKKAEQVIQGADNQSNKLLEEARAKREELLKKIE